MGKGPDAARLIGLGFFVGGCIVGGVLVGLWLDSILKTRPAFLIIGLFIGLIAAFYGVYKMLKPFLNGKGKGDSR
jgi:ATP synthase protein I